MVVKVKKIIHFFLALAAYWFYGRPARKLIIVGVTGTKGKSTTCRFIASVLEAGGYKVGLLSTVEFQIGEKRWLNTRKMTMLGRGEIQKLLRDMVKAGCQYAVVETSSEGILQYRHIGLEYDIAIFTNLGTEHSERHGGFENLRADKGKMFKALTKHQPKVINGKKVSRVSIVNADDSNAAYYLNFPADKKWEYSLANKKISRHSHRLSGVTPRGDDGIPSAAGQDTSNKIHAHNVEATESGSNFVVEGIGYHLRLVGGFNVPNALAAIAVGSSQGIAPDTIAAGLAGVTMLPGRMEFIDAGQPFKVVVDYAHEPMSLTVLFTTLRQLAGSRGKSIAIVGSDGGGRDKGKREKMGAVAGQLTDIVIVTDVNCFDEDPKEIAEMLAVGARQAGKKDNENLFIEVDRRQAIEKAFALARAGDVVAITAKGTEPCIIVANGKRIPWDDRGVARELLTRK